jgi:hypothetical protein
LLLCTVKTDNCGNAIALDIKEFKSQDSKVPGIMVTRIDMLLGLDNNAMHTEDLDLTGHDVWLG